MPGLIQFYSVHHNCLSVKLLLPSLISTKFAKTFLLCMLYLSQIFQAKLNTLLYLTETLHCKLKVFITWNHWNIYINLH